ncbi:TRAP transporter small permease [Marinivivus vitaminiproducens]|uniref:TRAP transporter small permease n=1 Tax=Marinivivus vitaminiproducens TaxID=3035935 RepID=UPI00279D6A28|nr:TRAP transporter small permease [Geminicoccaceae bacterium SCSIO 64248]
MKPTVEALTVPDMAGRPPAEDASRLRTGAALVREPEALIAGVALVVVVMSTAWGVITRYLTAQPTPWTGEVAAIAFAWVVFVGSAAGFKHGMHVSIDMLVAKLPMALQTALRWAVDLLLLAFFAYVVWLGIGFTQQNWTNPTPVLRLPSSIIYVAVPIGFASMLVRHVLALVGRVRNGEAAS